MTTSNRLNKGPLKQAGKLKKSQSAARERRALRGDDVGPQSLAPEPVRSLAVRVQAEREQLFKALAIVECCKYAGATLLEVSHEEYIVSVFDAICDLINASAGELGRIVDDCRHFD